MPTFSVGYPFGDSGSRKSQGIRSKLSSGSAERGEQVSPLRHHRLSPHLSTTLPQGSQQRLGKKSHFVILFDCFITTML